MASYFGLRDMRQRTTCDGIRSTMEISGRAIPQGITLTIQVPCLTIPETRRIWAHTHYRTIAEGHRDAMPDSISVYQRGPCRGQRHRTSVFGERNTAIGAGSHCITHELRYSRGMAGGRQLSPKSSRTATVDQERAGMYTGNTIVFRFQCDRGAPTRRRNGYRIAGDGRATQANLRPLHLPFR